MAMPVCRAIANVAFLSAAAMPGGVLAQETASIPSEIRGIWGLEGCSGEGMGLLVLTGTGAFGVDGGDVEPLDISLRSEPDDDGWAQANLDGSKGFVRHLPDVPGLEIAVPADTSAGQGPSGRPGASPDPAMWSVLNATSCAALPPGVQALYGETFAVLSAIHATEPACAEGPEGCADALFAAFDVHPDGRLNIAELSRLIRVAAQLGLIENGDGDILEHATLLAGSIPLAPILAHALVNSFDYNGDEGLTLAELLGDRLVVTSDLTELLSGAEGQVDEMLEALESGAADLGQMLMMLQ